MFLFAFIIKDAGAHRIRFHANAEHSAQADFGSQTQSEQAFLGTSSLLPNLLSTFLGLGTYCSTNPAE